MPTYVFLGNTPQRGRVTETTQEHLHAMIGRRMLALDVDWEVVVYATTDREGNALKVAAQTDEGFVWSVYIDV